MAAVDVRTMVGSPERQREKTIIHPFFGKPTKPQPKPQEPSLQSADLEPPNNADAKSIATTNHIDLNLSSLTPAAATQHHVHPPPPQETNLLEVDTNASRRKRRCTTSLKPQDESAPMSSHPSSSQDTALDLSPIKSRVSSRVDDEPSSKPSSHAPSLAEQPLSFFNKSGGPPAAVSETASQLEDTAQEVSDIMAPQQPKKMLNFNTKSGTIGSPPAKKMSKAAAKKATQKEAALKQVGEEEAVKVNVIAPKKAAKPKEKGREIEGIPKSKIIKFSYGKDEERRMRVGYEIDAVMEGTERVELRRLPTKAYANKKRPRKSATLPKAVNTIEPAQNADVKIDGNKGTVPPEAKVAPKAAHPFFLGKTAAKATAKPEESRAVKPSSSASSRQTTPARAQPKTKTSVTPKKSVRTGPQGTFAANNVINFPAFSTTAKQQKIPGALEPAWPWQGMSHIRGELDSLPMLLHDDASTAFTSPKLRKLKYAAPMPNADEDILEALISRLNLEAIREEVEEQAASSHHLPADKHLRVPNRYFESGVKLQRRIGPQIKASLSERVEIDDSEDELAKQNPGIFPHFAISSLYRKIPNSLSAFDNGESDTQTWALKYAPTSAKEVLQSGADAQILKSWLQSLTVDAVDNGAVKRDSSPEKIRKKDDVPASKKRKAKKLDGFVVSDDDEENEMEEVLQLGDRSPGNPGGLKTVVRRGDMLKGSKEPAKLMNAVLLSGPNGCGKTAAIYAVAKELDFEIFEINSSTRRSGKDILEKVGDMTKNHLVQHKPHTSPGTDDDLQRASDALEADLKSGRQGTMMSFFNKTAATKPKKTKPKITLKVKKLEKADPQQADPPKSKVQQKQSLILLEEVDVLYEEDKEFWKTILDLAQSSKRPIIMTCNDETLVPKQALPLHAIVRFAPPPIEMAVDYLLLVAANEGHVLHRHSVTQLYETHKHDLRASLADLEFWCQFGVGDRRGGFDWFIPRWPKGQDLDAHGRKLRVVSEGTYRAGMGMLGHDYLCSTNNISNEEEEMLKEAWDGWQLDAGDWHDSLKLAQWSNKAKVPSGNGNLMDALEAYEDFTDAMSSADICSHGWYGTQADATLDTSSPPTFPKALDDNVLGSSFIQADMVHRQTSLERDIAISLKCMARAAAQKHASQFSNAGSTSFQPITEKQVDRFIISSLNKEPDGLTRHDFGAALDPIAAVDAFAEQTSSYFQSSVIDRTAEIIAVDVAPYVRGIVAYDAKLADERKKLSNLLSEGGRPGRKKMRTTRAAMSALEGGERKSTRRERWFGDKANGILIARTGKTEWQKALEHEMQYRKEQEERDKEEAGVKVKRQEA